MKTTLTFLFSIFLLSFAIFHGCSTSDISQENRMEFISKSVLTNGVTIYKYKFNFEGNAWMNIAAYVKKENLDYIISINEPAENNINFYTYLPYLDEQNLEITNRVRKETVYSLEEAIEKSILFYLSDSI